jgi:CPA2 family monovalent cation:H+ antiporter-2
MNPETVKKELAKGEIIYYGDATQQVILEHAHIETAMILVITIPHRADTKRILKLAKKLNPNIHVIIRTRFISDVKELYESGSDEVIPEEFETSVEIFTRVLAKYLVPQDEIENLVKGIRSDNYEMFRSLSLDEESYSKLKVKVPPDEESGNKKD